MKWLRSGWILVIAGLSFILATCSPSPSQQTSPATAPTPAATIKPASGPVNPTDDAWATLIEAAKKEGKVNVYSYTWVGDIGLNVSKAFKDKYGIRLDILTGRGAEFLERLKTEKRMRQQVADITEGSSVHLGNMKIEGLLVSLTDKLPSFQEKGVWLVEPTAIDPQDKANLAYRIIEYSPYINTKLVKPEEAPKSWNDFLDPKWVGKMTLLDPNLSPGTYQSIVVFMDAKVWDEKYVKNLYQQKLRFTVSEYDDLRILARGESYITLKSADGTAAQLANDNAPIQAIDMKEGMVVTTSSSAAIAGSPNPNAGKLFLNWMFSAEGQSIIGKAQSNKMVRKDVPDFRPKAVQLTMTKPLVISNEQLDKATALFREKWFDKLVGR